ncbi:conjugal transfer protein TraH [Acinetobacter sp.]|uniref:conjugal transfer protein TraH n=1 Tax=Acinetobacter sp. TaxID=472 RepID=UPI003D0946AA
MKIKSIIKRTAVISAISIASLVPQANANGLQNQLNKMFDSMSATTAPGVFETQTRGVIAGGRFTMKNKIFNENIVSFIPPSFSGSCSGIDIFGGSFSFINGEQFIALLRSIAANAAGYAFQQALGVVCPDCAHLIDTLQNKIQTLNQFLGNSCQLGKGLVVDTFDAMGLKHDGSEGFIAQGKGLIQDMLSGWSRPTGKSAAEINQENNPETAKQSIGNMVWKQLKKNDTKRWFSSGDEVLMEAMMSLTGSVIIHEVAEAPDSTSGSSTPAKASPYSLLPGNKINLRDFIVGGNVHVYSCDGDKEHCMIQGEVGADKAVPLVGLKKQLDDVFLGTGSSIGLIFKLHAGAPNATSTEQQMMSNMPNDIGALISNLSHRSTDLGATFIREASGAIATAMAYKLATDMIRAVRMSMANSNEAYAKETIELIDNSLENIHKEHDALLNEFGNISNLHEKYQILMQNSDKLQLINTNMNQG